MITRIIGVLLAPERYAGGNIQKEKTPQRSDIPPHLSDRCEYDTAKIIGSPVIVIRSLLITEQAADPHDIAKIIDRIRPPEEIAVVTHGG